MRAQMIIGLIRLLGHLPLGLARALGAGLGLLGWWTKTRAARVTLDNLRRCYPDMGKAESRRLARASLIETGKLAVEICVLQTRDYAWLERRILARHGESLVHDAMAAGKGLILLAPHIGNWEVLSLLLPSYGPLTALYQPPKQAYLEPLIKKARQKTGATLVPTSPKGIAALLKSVRAGGITAVLPDQNPQWGFGEFAPFFGHPVYTMTTVHGFLRRVSSPVLMGMVKRVAGGFEVHYFTPGEEIYSEDQALSLAALNRGVEACIALAPEQYQWEYKRFKYSDQSEASAAKTSA